MINQRWSSSYTNNQCPCEPLVLSGGVFFAEVEPGEAIFSPPKEPS